MQLRDGLIQALRARPRAAVQLDDGSQRWLRYPVRDEHANGSRTRFRRNLEPVSHIATVHGRSGALARERDARRDGYVRCALDLPCAVLRYIAIHTTG